MKDQKTLLLEARVIIAGLIDALNSPFPGEQAVVSSLGTGDTAIEKGVAWLKHGWDEKSQAAVDAVYAERKGT